MTPPRQREYCKRFILKQREYFRKAAAGFTVDKTHPTGVQRWHQGNKEYYKHALATCAFMLKQLEFYREFPNYPNRHKPTR